MVKDIHNIGILKRDYLIVGIGGFFYAFGLVGHPVLNQNGVGVSARAWRVSRGKR